MCNTTKTTAPTIAKLTSALHGFLTTNQLPDPAAVRLSTTTRCIDIQPAVAAFTDPVAVLSALLMWTRALSGITATWWRINDGHGDRVHINVAGRLLNGIAVHVYDGIPYQPICEWLLLEPGQHESVSLDELAWLIRELHCARPAA
jgi:hypothetical protein